MRRAESPSIQPVPSIAGCWDKECNRRAGIDGISAFFRKGFHRWRLNLYGARAHCSGSLLLQLSQPVLDRGQRLRIAFTRGNGDEPLAIASGSVLPARPLTGNRNSGLLLPTWNAESVQIEVHRIWSSSLGSRSPHRNARQAVLQDSHSQISDVACPGHAIASAAKRLRSNGLLGTYKKAADSR